MHENYRAVTRLPALTQFLLAPFTALLGALAYTAFHWTQSDWGALETAKNQQFHLLGWMIMPLVLAAGALFMTAINRGLRGERSDRFLAATLLTAGSVVVLAYAWSQTLTT